MLRVDGAQSLLTWRKPRTEVLRLFQLSQMPTNTAGGLEWELGTKIGGGALYYRVAGSTVRVEGATENAPIT